MQSIGSDLLGEGWALSLCFGQAVILDPMAIALKPVGRDLLKQPVWSSLGQIIPCRAPRFSDAFQIRERAHPRQHMRGVSALVASSFQPATLLAYFQ